jgi:hypothetical protein
MTEFPDTPNRQPKETSKNSLSKIIRELGWLEAGGMARKQIIIFVNRVFKKVTANPTNCSGL